MARHHQRSHHHPELAALNMYKPIIEQMYTNNQVFSDRIRLLVKVSFCGQSSKRSRRIEVLPQLMKAHVGLAG
jgi:hypothetical protein